MFMLGATGLGVVAGAFISRLLGRSPDPDEAERQRRAYLNQVGRIVEGQITDLVEVAEDAVPHKRARNSPMAVARWSATAIRFPG